MSIFTSFDINASGMTAQRYRMDVISENVANADTTRTEDGTPYRRKVVTFQQKGEKVGSFSSVFGKASDAYKGQGVRVSKVSQDTWTEMIKAYDPSCRRQIMPSRTHSRLASGFHYYLFCLFLRIGILIFPQPPFCLYDT